MVAAIWSVSNGYADDVPVGDIVKFEAGLISFLENLGTALGLIRDKRQIDDEAKTALNNALKEFKERYNAAAKSAAS